MKYRVEVDVSFADKQDAVDLLNYVEKVKGKAVDCLTSALPLVKTCRYHECYHDEIPVKPCGNYTTVDFAGDEKEHK